MSNSNWTLLDFIYKNLPNSTVENVARAINRSPAFVAEKAERLGISEKHEFTDDEIKLANQYNKSLGPAMFFILEGRTSYEAKELCKCGRS